MSQVWVLDAGDWATEHRTNANNFIELNDIDPELWWFYVVMLGVLFLFFRGLSIIALANFFYRGTKIYPPKK